MELYLLVLASTTCSTSIVHSPWFQSSVVKVQLGKQSKRACCSETSERPVYSEERHVEKVPSFCWGGFEKRRREASVRSEVYTDMRFLITTSIIYERMFSKDDYVIWAIDAGSWNLLVWSPRYSFTSIKIFGNRRTSTRLSRIGYADYPDYLSSSPSIIG